MTAVPGLRWFGGEQIEQGERDGVGAFEQVQAGLVVSA
jgi:hypothetical protein